MATSSVVETEGLITLPAMLAAFDPAATSASRVSANALVPFHKPARRMRARVAHPVTLHARRRTLRKQRSSFARTVLSYQTAGQGRDRAVARPQASPCQGIRKRHLKLRMGTAFVTHAGDLQISHKHPTARES
jgi:hypothetical protein